MALDAGIYSGFGPPKSVAEYDREAIELENARSAQQINALALAEGQRKAARGAQLNALAAGWGSGTSDEQRVNALRGGGFFDEARSVEKDLFERQKTVAAIEQSKAETLTKKLGNYRDALGGINNPQAAAQWLQAQYADPDVGPHISRFGSFDESLGRIPADPAAFQQWRMQSALGLEKFAELSAKGGDKDPFTRMMSAAGIDPASPQGRQMLLAKLQKESQHAPPASVQVGLQAPVQAVDPATGQTVFVQPANKPGAAPQVLAGPGGKAFTAPPKASDTKLPAEIQRMNAAADTMESLLGRYESMLEKNNPRDFATQSNPTTRAQMQSLMKNIQLQFKELQALGALAGPDLAIMEAALTDPFTLRGAYYGPKGLKAQIGEARNLIKERRAAIGKAQGASVPTSPGERSEPTPAASVPTSPKPGSVQDGWRFKGGNPADPKSWERV